MKRLHLRLIIIWIGLRVAIWWPTALSDDTKQAAMGGSLATEENGKRWLQVAVKEKIAHILEIHEQQERRLPKESVLPSILLIDSLRI